MRKGEVIYSKALENAKSNERMSERDNNYYGDMVAVEWEDGSVGWHKKGALIVEETPDKDKEQRDSDELEGTKVRRE